MAIRPQMDETGRLLADVPKGDNAPPFSVSELSSSLKRTVEDRFGHVRVRGEISGWKRAASGHCYLTLKDDKATLDTVLWKGSAAKLAFDAQDGVEVIATGKLTTYPGRSKYQLVADSLELAGEGALMQLLEKLKAKLAGEGLFAPERKRALPFIPRRIGVVTSPTGAVIRDILHRLSDRFPSEVLVWPVQVQGEKAAGLVANAIAGFNAMEDGERPDLLIVARGGGSIEDLWAFNEEVVVRAIAGSSIPVISAVGHETDTTLSDYAADRRAPTPTAAAEIAVPVRGELLAHVSQQGVRMQTALSRRVEQAAERLEAQRRLLADPRAMVDQRGQRVDDLGERLGVALGARADRAAKALAEKSGALRPSLLEQRLTAATERLARATPNVALLDRLHQRGAERFNGLSRLLEQLDPDRPLDRGFARLTGVDGLVITSAAAARKAGTFSVKFADGALGAIATDSPPKKPRARKEAPDPALKQETLF